MSLKANLDGVRVTYRLCFVRAPWAFLTRLSLDQQWGENWQHSPYQQFAGTPSHHLPDQLLTVAFDGPLYTPDTGYDNGSHSVLEINAGFVPWLRAESYAGGPPLHIMAGATLESFVTSVELAGGQVYVPLGWGIQPGMSSLAAQVRIPA
jgi:hypothetical protein